MIDPECPLCGSPAVTVISFKCGTQLADEAGTLIQSAQCQSRVAAQDEGVDAAIERRRLRRHFGDQHAEV